MLGANCRQFMARAGIDKAIILILPRWGAKRNQSRSIFGAGNQCELPPNVQSSGDRDTIERSNDLSSSCWVPHPRNGIYVPKGKEELMDDVPPGAASLGGQTYWLRNVDGVEKPIPDYGHNYCGFASKI